MNCRSIPQETWDHVRQCLIFFFSRRGLNDAEDLTQETLLAVWKRMDYEFEKEEDFLRICYAFARRVLLSCYRGKQKHAAIDPDTASTGSAPSMSRLTAADLSIFLDEVLQIARSQLNEKDWHLIEASMGVDFESPPGSPSPGDRGNMRVYLHRARRKLARLTGWRKD